MFHLHRHLRGGTPLRPRQEGQFLHPRRSWLGAVLFLVVVIGIGGFFLWQKAGHGSFGGAISGVPFATQEVDGLTVTFIAPKGQLENSMNDILIEFRDSVSGQLVNVGLVKFDLNMNMPGMVMHSSATIERIGAAGEYRAKINPGMTGDWTATLHYEGPHGKGDVSFSVNVKQ